MARVADLAVASPRSKACESWEGQAVIRIEIGAMPRLLRSIVCSALETDGDMTVIARGEAGPG